MQLNQTSLPGVVEIVPTRHGDNRGYFSETFRVDWFEQNVGLYPFVQENESLSRRRGVVRGLHFQAPRMAQGKLVRCVAGALFDVAVDIRAGSPTYGKWTAVTLTAEAGNQLWIPPGFAHGFCTLTDDVIAAYKVTAYYSREHDLGVAWNDPDIGVTWPDTANPKSVSGKDSTQPALRDLQAHFT